ncbi:TPA: hypothetical protein ACH3X1_013533 [Trebouxia sp. C0004]
MVPFREYRSDRVHTAASQQRSDHCLSRRALQAELVASLAFAIPLRACSAEVESTSPAANADNELDLTVTEKVFLDIGLCPEGLRSDRTLGDASAICTDATPLGRVTIGPGPASALDGENIVFGRVLQGYDTMTAIQSVPTFRPFNERVSSFNKLASFLKDERADRVRAKWGKPLKAIVIMGAGMA